MAATVKLSNGNIIAITAIDVDWTWTTTFPEMVEGIHVASIIFTPGANNDKLLMLDQSDSGGRIFPDAALPDKAPLVVDYPEGTWIKPHIDFDNSTLNAGHSVLILARNSLRSV